MTATKNTPEKPTEVKPFGRRVKVDFLYLAACSRLASLATPAWKIELPRTPCLRTSEN